MTATQSESAVGAEACVLHPFEPADRICHQCGNWHCDGCLVLPWGPRKPALCVSCAIGRAGVRSSAKQAPTRTPRDIRRIERQERREVRDAARRPVVITAQGMDRSVPVPTLPEPPREKRGVLRRLGLT